MKCPHETNGLRNAWLGIAVVAIGCGGAMETESPAAGGAPFTTTQITTTQTCVPGNHYCVCSGNGTCVAGLACIGNTCQLSTSIASGGTTSTSLFQGGSPGSGGTQITTSTTIAPDCTAITNLIAEAVNGPSLNWVGGDPASMADNPCGVQGAVYAISDDGLDNVPGGQDATIQWPPLDFAASGENRLSPCDPSMSGCCISGTTSRWPTNGTYTDYTASVWGGYLRISLNDPGAGGTLRPYQGPINELYVKIKGFYVTIMGTLNGQLLRLGYGQSPNDNCEPFRQVAAVGTYSLPFLGGGVTCPTWSCTPGCIAPSANPYELTVQVVGGDAAGAFDICVTKVTPIF